VLLFVCSAIACSIFNPGRGVVVDVLTELVPLSFPSNLNIPVGSHCSADTFVDGSSPRYYRPAAGWRPDLQTADRVIFFFSVNLSKHFQGYAIMAGRIGADKNAVWVNDSGQSWGAFHKTVWLRYGANDSCLIFHRHCVSAEVG